MIFFLGAAWLYLAVLTGSCLPHHPGWAAFALLAGAWVGVLWQSELKATRP